MSLVHAEFTVCSLISCVSLVEVLEMPRGRAWQHSDGISHQSWLKVLQGKRPPAEKWLRSSEAGSATSTRSGQGAGSPVACDRIAKLEAALAVVGEEDDTAPQLQEALRMARRQAQILLVKVRLKSCEFFLKKTFLTFCFFFFLKKNVFLNVFLFFIFTFLLSFYLLLFYLLTFFTFFYLFTF